MREITGLEVPVFKEVPILEICMCWNEKFPCRRVPVLVRSPRSRDIYIGIRRI